MLNRLLRPETGFYLGIWLFLMVGGRSRLFRDPGTFWHTCIGAPDSLDRPAHRHRSVLVHVRRQAVGSL